MDLSFFLLYYLVLQLSAFIGGSKENDSLQNQKKHRNNADNCYNRIKRVYNILEGAYNLYIILQIHSYASKSTACATDGIGLPCLLVVGDISAPVATKSTFLSSPFFIRFIMCEQSTDALQPHPEPPLFTSCSFKSKIINPQSLCFLRRLILCSFSKSS